MFTNGLLQPLCLCPYHLGYPFVPLVSAVLYNEVRLQLHLPGSQPAWRFFARQIETHSFLSVSELCSIKNQI